MEKIKEILKDKKVLTILCIVVLSGMLILTCVELFSSSKATDDDFSCSNTSFTQLDQYLSKINGVEESYTYVSYDELGSPMGVIVLCKNLNKETEIKLKTAVHVITGVSLSKICVYEAGNN